MVKPCDLLTNEEMSYVKDLCVTFDCPWVRIDGIKFVNLPIEKWKK